MNRAFQYGEERELVSACSGIDITRGTIARLQPVPFDGGGDDKFYLDDKVNPMLAACVRLLGTVRPVLQHGHATSDARVGGACLIAFLSSLVLVVRSPPAGR